MRILRLFVAFSLTAAFSTPLVAQQPEEPVASKTGAVITTSGPASDVGAAILRRDGDAVDAAVATAFAPAVTHPSAGNIGGGGFILRAIATKGPNAFYTGWIADSIAASMSRHGGLITKRDLDRIPTLRRCRSRSSCRRAMRSRLARRSIQIAHPAVRSWERTSSNRLRRRSTTRRRSSRLWT